MEIIAVDASKYNTHIKLTGHIVQSTIWASFRESKGAETVYLTADEKGKVVSVWMMYITEIPHTKGKWRIGVISECNSIPKELVTKLQEIGKEKNLLFIKCEPLLEDTPANRKKFTDLGFRKGTDYFLKSTFILDITGEKDAIFKKFSSSTRRNIRIAEKKSVYIEIQKYKKGDYTAIDTYLRLLVETKERHQFALHNSAYFHSMYDILKDTMVILEAKVGSDIVGSMVLFIYNDVCYYPYGASQVERLDTKAINLLVYESILYAKEAGCKSFNFWGALPEPADTKHPLYGVHAFKKGYSGKLYTYIGAYDLVIDEKRYFLFAMVFTLYWKGIKFVRKLKG